MGLGGVGEAEHLLEQSLVGPCLQAATVSGAATDDLAMY